MLFNQKIVNFSVGFMSVLLILAIISKLNIVMNRLHLKVTALLVVSIVRFVRLCFNIEPEYLSIID